MRELLRGAGARPIRLMLDSTGSLIERGHDSSLTDSYVAFSGQQYTPVGSLSEFMFISGGAFNVNYKLEGDLYLMGTGDYIDDPEYPFMGVLNGNGKNLYNLRAAYGLFAYIRGTPGTPNAGTIRNRGIESGEVLGGGSFAAANGGSIIACYSKATVTGTGIGGIVRDNHHDANSSYAASMGGTIIACYYNGRGRRCCCPPCWRW